jgi:RNA polymerase sigma-70 factor (ECF subfamily)
MNMRITFLRAENHPAIGEGPKEWSEAELLSAAKSGDADAFVELSKRHYRRILRTTYRITRNQQDAEDALQESLMQAFSHLHKFQEKCSFSTWLTRIAINAALMTLRKRRTGFEISIDGSDDHGHEQWDIKANTEDPESHFVRREREELLKGAILGLSPLCREVVDLWRAKEFSTREIAGALGISVPAVKSRLARARLTLRGALLPIDS